MRTAVLMSTTIYVWSKDKKNITEFEQQQKYPFLEP